MWTYGSGPARFRRSWHRMERSTRPGYHWGPGSRLGGEAGRCGCGSCIHMIREDGEEALAWRIERTEAWLAELNEQ